MLNRASNKQEIQRGQQPASLKDDTQKPCNTDITKVITKRVRKPKQTEEGVTKNLGKIPSSELSDNEKLARGTSIDNPKLSEVNPLPEKEAGNSLSNRDQKRVQKTTSFKIGKSNLALRSINPQSAGQGETGTGFTKSNFTPSSIPTLMQERLASKDKMKLGPLKKSGLKDLSKIPQSVPGFTKDNVLKKAETLQLMRKPAPLPKRPADTNFDQ